MVVRLAGDDGATHEVACNLAMDAPILHLHLPAAVAAPAIRRVTAWEYVGEHLASIGFDPPRPLDSARLAGWVQRRPADPPLCLGYRRAGADLWVAVVYGDDDAAAMGAATGLLDAAAGRGAAALRAGNRRWWSAYWADVPRLALPNPALAFLYDYGMYKFAGLTAPGGVPATLQGPWVEEYQMPPWSSDYHFNINVQMCYWPAYRGNRLTHLRPLFEMVWGWRDELRRNARHFVGIDDGLMLPHAVDDRCANMGGFWSGTVDHGCTAWVAKMMYDYWRYGGDDQFLREIAYPFMAGALRVYEAMLARDGDRFALPISVSPEYRGSALDAWGRNASFQLACVHWLCEALTDAAAALGEPPSPAWQEIREGLPRACLIGAPGQERIALWEGTPLEESHRHHSHLAGLVPFDTLDADDPAWAPVVRRSFDEWVRRGMGLWSGWCVPWAAMLHTRVGNAAMAELLLELWQRVFTNEGHGTLHDYQFPGFTLISAGARNGGREIMQMDAGMGAAAAIMELLLQTRCGVNHLFAGAPAGWREAGFAGLRTEGGFLVGAHRTDGRVREVTVRAERGGVFRLANPWAGGAVVARDGRRETVDGPVLAVALGRGKAVALTPAGGG